MAAAVAAPLAATARQHRSLLLAYAILLTSCGTPTEPGGGGVVRIEVDPPSVSVVSGASTTVSARVIGSAGEVLTDRRVFWSSQNQSIATVSQSGTITAVAIGTTQVAASSGGQAGLVSVTVLSRPISLVRVHPTAATVLVGDTVQLTAEAVDAGGDVVPGVDVAWSSSDLTVASVDDEGRVIGIGDGSAEISATVNGRSGIADLTVTRVPVKSIEITPPSLQLAIGASDTLTAVAKDEQGNVLGGREITWISGAPTIATVTQAGVVVGVGPGTASIFAASEQVSQSAQVTVAAVPVASVRVTPPSANLNVGEFIDLTAEPLDASGNVLGDRIVAWSSSNQSVAVVSSTGRVQSVSAGSVTITATSETKTGSSTITVGLIPAASITLAPAPLTIVAGQTAALSATVKDAAGNVLSGRAITWSSDNPAIASVDASGVVAGVTPGTATVTAICEAVSTTVTVNVTQVPIALITVSPPSSGVVEGSTLQLTAVAKDAAGNTIPASVFWQSSAPTVAGVSATGLVTGISAGAATITASAPGAGPGGTTPSGASSITVTLATVAAVIGSPASGSVSVGSSAPFTATLQSATGAPLSPIGRVISWRSFNPGIATVDAFTGVAVGVAPGTTDLEVSAASPGQAAPAKDTVSVTVTNVPVASVTVQPGPSATVYVGGVYQRTFTATPKDANGQPLSGRPVVWTSADPSLATVNATTGVVTGVATGAVTITATVEGVPGSSNVTVGLVPISSTSVTPTSLTLAVPQTSPLTATPKDSANNTIAGAALGGRTPSWSSSAPTVATVSGAGVVTAVGAGSSNVTATFPGSPASNPSAVTVLTPVVSVDMSVAPADSIFDGATATATATAKDASGNPVPIGGSRTMVWASTNTAVATVSQSGVITSVNAGSATITATVQPDNVAGSLPIRVLAPIATITVAAVVDSLLPGGSTNLTAVARDAGGNQLSGRPLTWASSSGSVTVNTGATGATNVANAVSVGSANVTASAEGKVGTEGVRVLAPVTQVQVSLSSPDVFTGQTVQATATLRDGSGNPVGGRQINWSASNGKATINAAGVITGVDSGAVTFTATVPFDNNISGTSGALTVHLVPVASVTVSPLTQQLTVGDHFTFTATAKDASGNPLSGRATTWSSSNPAKATIDAVTGEAIALDSGSVVFTATVEGVQGQATSQVFLIPIGSVSFTPSSIPNLGAGQQRTVTLDVKASGGGGLPGRACTVSTGNGLLALVGPPGGPSGLSFNALTDSQGKIDVEVTAVLPLNVTITAVCEAHAAQLPVN